VKKATADKTKGADESQRCLSAALRYISLRPRSEAELRERLARRGFAPASLEAAVASLRAQGLVDDAAFAHFWQENRQACRPRSLWLTRQELRQKGVADDIIAAALAGADDIASAEAAARNWARRLANTDYDTFRRRLGDFLRRRGFGYRVIGQTVDRLWQEREA